MAAGSSLHEEGNGVYFYGTFNAAKKRHGPGILIDQKLRFAETGTYNNGFFEGETVYFDDKLNNLKAKN